jgi:hypothetical protein
MRSRRCGAHLLFSVAKTVYILPGSVVKSEADHIGGRFPYWFRSANSAWGKGNAITNGEQEL